MKKGYNKVGLQLVVEVGRGDQAQNSPALRVSPLEVPHQAHQQAPYPHHKANRAPLHHQLKHGARGGGEREEGNDVFHEVGFEGLVAYPQQDHEGDEQGLNEGGDHQAEEEGHHLYVSCYHEGEVVCCPPYITPV